MAETDKEVVERIRRDCARIEGLLLAHIDKCSCYGNQYVVGMTGEDLYFVVKSLLGFAHQSRVKADNAERRLRTLEEDFQRRLDMVTAPLHQKLKESQEEAIHLRRLLKERGNLKTVSRTLILVGVFMIVFFSLRIFGVIPR